MNARRAIAIVVALAAGTAAGQEIPQACRVPAGMMVTDASLPRVAKRLAEGRPLEVVVLGSGSSAGAGVSDRSRAYPAVLQRELAKRFPGQTVNVESYARRGATAAEMTDWLEREIVARKPALVVWQTGTADAVKNVELSDFGDALAKGIAALHAQDIDVMLIDMQYGPQTDALLQLKPYQQYMQWAARTAGVPLFRRHDVMEHWSEQGAVDLAATNRRAQLNAADFVHDCLGRLLAAAIDQAARGRRGAER
jgi:lysophospholipase L1-like esterase